MKNIVVSGAAAAWCAVAILLLLMCGEKGTGPDPDPVDPDTAKVLRAPFDVRGAASRNHIVTLQWQDTSGAVPYYAIERADSTGGFVAIDTIRNPKDTVIYPDRSPKKSHGTYRYRLYSFWDTLVSTVTDTVTVTLPNNPPVLEITNYDRIVNGSYMVHDTIFFYLSVFDADTDAVVLNVSNPSVVITGDTGRLCLADTKPDTVEFVCFDNYGGRDSVTVVISRIDTNNAPVFNAVYLPDFGIAGQRVTCGYSITEPDGHTFTLHIDSMVNLIADPRDLVMHPDDSAFSFLLLPHDTGLTRFVFFARDLHGAWDSLGDTLPVVTGCDLVFNTTAYDSVSVLARFDVNGANGHYITQAKDSVGASAVSPANDRVVYQKRCGSHNEIRLIDAKGTADNLLFVDSQKIWYPASWSFDGTSLAFRVTVPDSGTWRIVTGAAGAADFDTVCGGIPLRKNPSGPLYSSRWGEFIFSGNDTIFSYAPTRGITPIVSGAAHPQVMQSTGTLFYYSVEAGHAQAGCALVRAAITGAHPVVIREFASSEPGYMAVNQSGALVYGLVVSGTASFSRNTRPAWLYFAAYNRLADVTLTLESGRFNQ